MQEANVSRYKRKISKMLRRGELPCVRRKRSFDEVQIIGDVRPIAMEGKSDKEVKRLRRLESCEKLTPAVYSHSGV